MESATRCRVTIPERGSTSTEICEFAMQYDEILTNRALSETSYNRV